MRIFTAQDVKGLVSLKEVRELMKATLLDLGRYPQSPPRFPLGEGEGLLGVMPEAGIHTNAVKIVSLAKGKGHEGVIAVFDKEGSLRGVIEAGIITALRTAAVSVVVTQAVMPTAKKIAVMGRGRQAQAHREAFAEAYPEATILSTMEGCDVLCTFLTSKDPQPLPLNLPKRVHINSVGSDEIPNLQATFILDHRLDELLTYPKSFSGITFFKSRGLPCEDLALAELCLERL